MATPMKEIELCDTLCRIDFFTAIKKSREEIVDFFINHKILPYFRACENCGSLLIVNRPTMKFRCHKNSVKKAWRNNGRRRSRCEFHHSARVRSFIHRMNLNISSLWCLIVSILYLPAPRYKFASQNFGISAQSHSNWSFYIREVFVHYFEIKSTVIGGPDSVIEIDQGKSRKMKVQNLNQEEVRQLPNIIIGYDRTTKQVFISPVPDKTPEVLLSIIQKYVRPGTTIISDCWKTYKCKSSIMFQSLKNNRIYDFQTPDVKNDGELIRAALLWREVQSKGSRYCTEAPFIHYIGLIAEFFFKRIIDYQPERLHYFCEAAASLYPVV